MNWLNPAVLFLKHHLEHHLDSLRSTTSRFLAKRSSSSTTSTPFEASLAMSCQGSLDHEVMFYNIVMWGTVLLALVNLVLVRGWAQSWAQSRGLNLPTNSQAVGTVLCCSGLGKIIAAILLLTLFSLKCPLGCECDGSIGFLNLYPYIVIVVALVCLSHGMELRGMEFHRSVKLRCMEFRRSIVALWSRGMELSRRSIVALWSRGMELSHGEQPNSPIMHRQCSEEADAVAAVLPATSNLADSRQISRQFTPLGVSFDSPKKMEASRSLPTHFNKKMEAVKTPRPRSESPKMRSLIPNPVGGTVATPQAPEPAAKAFETGTADA